MPEASTTHNDSPVEDGSPEDYIGAISKFLSDYSRELVFAAVLLVGAGAVYAIMQYQQDKAESEAWGSLHAIMAKNDRARDGKLEGELGELARKHTGTSAAAFAEVSRMVFLGDGEKLPEAVAAADSFLKNNPGHFFAVQVMLFKAQLLMREGNPKDAKAVIKQALAKVNNGESAYLEPQLSLALAQSLEQEAELARGSEEYISLLDVARDAYVKVSGRGTGENAWPVMVVQQASFAVTAIKERIRAVEAGESLVNIPVEADSNTMVPPKPEDAKADGKKPEVDSAKPEAKAEESKKTE